MGTSSYFRRWRGIFAGRWCHLVAASDPRGRAIPSGDVYREMIEQCLVWYRAKGAQIFGKRIREQPGCYTNQHQQPKSCDHHVSLWLAQIASQ